MILVMLFKYFSCDEIVWKIYEANKEFITFKWLVKGLTDKDQYCRYMYIWWVKIATSMVIDMVKKWVNPFKTRDYMNLVKPVWYDH